MSVNTYRRVTGLILGALLGLAYGLTSQALNPLILMGVPLHQPPFGAIGNLLLIAACGGVLGAISAWSEGSASGIIAASVISAVVIVVGNLLQSTMLSGPVGVQVMSLFLVLPFAGMLAPGIALHRWAVNRLVEDRRDGETWLRRLWRPTLLLLAAGAIGALTLYPSEGRTLLRRTDALLRAGQAAQGAAALPEPLRAVKEGVFLQRGQGPYALAWERQRIERYQIPRPAENFDAHTVVVAYFKNGWNLACLYVTPAQDPICVGMDTVPK